VLAFLLCGILLVTTAIFVLVANRNKKEQVTINVYNWGELISDGKDDTIDVNLEFTKKTGIKVNYTTFQNNESLLAKLRNGGSNYDVIIPSDYMISKLIEYNMLEKLDFEKIPNFNYVDSNFKNLVYDPENSYSVPYLWGTVGIIYNKKFVDVPEKDINWDIFWNEKYKGKILMFDNPRDAFAISQFSLGLSVNDLSKENWEKAFQKLKQQKSLVNSYVMDQIFDKMGNEEASIAPYYTGDAINLIKKNPNLKLVIPKEGTNKFIDAMCIPKGAEHYSEALQYINFMCSPEISKANSIKTGYSSPEKIVRERENISEDQKYLNELNNEVEKETQVFNGLPDDLNRKIEEMWVLVKVGDKNNSACLIATLLILILLLIFSVLNKKNLKTKKF